MYRISLGDIDVSEYEEDVKDYIRAKPDAIVGVSGNAAVRSLWRVFEAVLNSCGEMKHCHGETVDYSTIFEEKISARKVSIKGRVSWRDNYGIRFSFFQIDIDRRTPKLLYSIKILRRSTKVQKQAIYVGKTNSDWLVGYKTLDFELPALGSELYRAGENWRRIPEEYDPDFDDLDSVRKKRQRLSEE